MSFLSDFTDAIKSGNAAGTWGVILKAITGTAEQPKNNLERNKLLPELGFNDTPVVSPKAPKTVLEKETKSNPDQTHGEKKEGGEIEVRVTQSQWKAHGTEIRNIMEKGQGSPEDKARRLNELGLNVSVEGDRLISGEAKQLQERAENVANNLGLKDIGEALKNGDVKKVRHAVDEFVASLMGPEQGLHHDQDPKTSNLTAPAPVNRSGLGIP